MAGTVQTISEDLTPYRKRMMDKDGFSKHRYETNPLEERYAKKWKEYNERGHMLEYLLSPTNRPEDTTMTERDCQVANALIQWLGSPCGIFFINSVNDD